MKIIRLNSRIFLVNDLAAAERAAGASAIASNDAIVVPAAAANGVMLAFVAW